MESFASHTLLVLVMCTSFQILQTVDADPQRPPSIRLFSYTLQDSFQNIMADQRFQFNDTFQNEFISKRKTDYVVSSEVRSVMFACMARYPIMWEYSIGNNLIRNFRTSDIRSAVLTPTLPEPLNTRFVSLLTVRFDLNKFFSKSLSCVSVSTERSQTGLKSEVYIFLNGTDRIENVGETLQLYADSTNTTINFPCRPSSPEIRLILEFEFNSGVSRTWQGLRRSEEKEYFDPKLGFTFRRIELSRIGIDGLYRCSVIESADGEGFQQNINYYGDFVIFNLTHSTTESPSDINFEPHKFLHGNASVHVKSDLNQGYEVRDVFCCSGIPNKPPLVFSYDCSGRQHCQLVSKSLERKFREQKVQEKLRKHLNTKNRSNLNMSSDCFKYHLYESVSSVVICQGENVDYLETFAHLLLSSAGGPVANRSKVVNKTPKPGTQDNSLTQYVTLSTAERATVSEKIIILLGRKIRADIPEKTFIQFLDVETDHNSDFRALVSQNRDILSAKVHAQFYEEFDRDMYYEGEPLISMCFGIKYFYAQRPHIRLNGVNDSKTVLRSDYWGHFGNSKLIPEFARFLYLNGKDDMLNGNGDLVVDKFSETVIAHKGMSSVDCWMPLKGSAKWDKVSNNLTILPSVAPKFAEIENKTLYLYLGDVGNVITCTVIEGLPTPELSATQDGIKLSSKEYRSHLNGTRLLVETKIVNKLKTLSVQFPNITHEHQCVVQCQATNVNGTVIRTVTIFVIERNGHAWKISTFIVGTLLVATVAPVGRHFYTKRKLQPILRGS